MIKRWHYEQVFIYVLKDPKTLDIRYVGQTIDVENRFRGHLSNSANMRKDKWVSSLLEENLLPIIEVIEICNENNSGEREKFWIRSLMKKCDLLNVSGRGPKIVDGIYVKEQIPTDLEKRLRIIAAELGISKSDCVRAAFEQYVNYLGNNDKTLTP